VFFFFCFRKAFDFVFEETEYAVVLARIIC